MTYIGTSNDCPHKPKDQGDKEIANANEESRKSYERKLEEMEYIKDEKAKDAKRGVKRIFIGI